MTDFQAEKALVLRFYEELDAAEGTGINGVLNTYTAPDYLWRGMHPFHVQNSAEAVTEVFWQPLRRSFRHIQRRPDVFMAGLNEIDGFRTIWVCSMGHLMGLFDEDWLGIPHSGKMAFLRYVEFHRLENGKIAETALFCDILSVMLQVGLKPLPPQTGAFLITPGPMAHDGLLHDPQDPVEGRATLALINRMIGDINSRERSNDRNAMRAELARCWSPGMIWWGPAGIGATYTIERYIRQHSGPFRDHLPDRTFNGHLARLAEGNFGGFFGWPNLTLRSKGGFMGLPGSDTPADMRVVDIYRRDGDRLAENWIFIDMLHFLYQQGVDVLERMKMYPRT